MRKGWETGWRGLAAGHWPRAPKAEQDRPWGREHLSGGWTGLRSGVAVAWLALPLASEVK